MQTQSMITNLAGMECWVITAVRWWYICSGDGSRFNLTHGAFDTTRERKTTCVIAGTIPWQRASILLTLHLAATSFCSCVYCKQQKHLLWTQYLNLELIHTGTLQILVMYHTGFKFQHRSCGTKSRNTFIYPFTVTFIYH